jgi:hypothetical protein
MSEKKYDSALIGWTEEPKFNDKGELMSWTIKLKDHELKDIASRYVTSRNEQGQGGNAYITLRVSKAGKAFATVYDPNSEAAKEKRTEKQNANASDDLPF